MPKRFFVALAGLVVLGVTVYASARSPDDQGRLECSMFGNGRAVHVTDAGVVPVEGTVTATPTGTQTIQGQDGGYPVTVYSAPLSQVFGSPGTAAAPDSPCIALNMTTSNASTNLTAGVRYKVRCLAASGCFLRMSDAAATDGTAEFFRYGDSALWTVKASHLDLNGILPSGAAAASPGAQACPYAE